MTERLLQPEWLDELAADEPSAIASRRDLRRLNRLMGHAAIIAHAIQSFPRPRRVLDLGAGDGSLTLRLAAIANWRDVEIILWDRAPVPRSVPEAFRSLDCRVAVVQRDVLVGWEDIGAVDCVVANLFLHHLAPADLTRLLALAAAHCNVFVACEPRRSTFALLASRLVGIIGCNAVTRHDAVASVRGGFRDQEISELWPDHRAWLPVERSAGLFSHLFVARKL